MITDLLEKASEKFDASQRFHSTTEKLELAEVQKNIGNESETEASEELYTKQTNDATTQLTGDSKEPYPATESSTQTRLNLSFKGTQTDPRSWSRGKTTYYDCKT